MKFETNYSLNKTARAKNYVCPGDSMTVPDQAISLQELLAKYTQGIAPAVKANGSFESDGEDFDDMNPLRIPGMDIVDIHEISENVSATINKYIAESKDKAEKKRLEAMKTEVEASLAKNKESQSKGSE